MIELILAFIMIAVFFRILGFLIGLGFRLLGFILSLAMGLIVFALPFLAIGVIWKFLPVIFVIGLLGMLPQLTRA